MYLQANDYKSYIQADQLRQLTQGDDSKRLQAEAKSMQQIIQKLTQRYDLSLEMRDTAPWDKDKAYGAGDRATVAVGANGFNTWATNTEYETGDAVIYNRTGYLCVTANHDASFTLAKWKEVAPENAVFHAAWPPDCTLRGQPNPATMLNPYAPMFNYQNLYNMGDVVWWAGNTYVCAQSSTLVDHQQALQYKTEQNLPIANVYPNDPIANANAAFWKDAAAYVITPGTPLTDTDAWVREDNRNASVKNWMVVLSVAHMSATLTVQNIPKTWADNAKEVYCDMQAAADGMITMILPPTYRISRGLRTRFGGDVKNKNYY